MNKPDLFIDALIALLNDDEGICESGFEALRDVIDAEFERPLPKKLENVLKHVDSCDGRFYLPEDYDEFFDGEDEEDDEDYDEEEDEDYDEDEDGEDNDEEDE